MKLPDVISSPNSKRIRNAAKPLNRRGRRAAGMFLAEGPQAVREALATEGAVDELFLTEAAAESHPEFVEAATGGRVFLSIVTEEVLTELASTVNSQGSSPCAVPSTSTSLRS